MFMGLLISYQDDFWCDVFIKGSYMMDNQIIIVGQNWPKKWKFGGCWVGGELNPKLTPK